MKIYIKNILVCLMLTSVAFEVTMINSKINRHKSKEGNLSDIRRTMRMSKRRFSRLSDSEIVQTQTKHDIVRNSTPIKKRRPMFRISMSEPDIMKKLMLVAQSLVDKDDLPNDTKPSQYIAPKNPTFGDVVSVPSGYLANAYPAILFKDMPHITEEEKNKVQKKLKKSALNHIMKSIDMDDDDYKPCVAEFMKTNSNSKSKAYGGILSALIKYANKEQENTLRQQFIACKTPKDFVEEFLKKFALYRSNFYMATSMFIDLNDIYKAPPKAAFGYHFEKK
jgi:hypothetical protein